MFSKCKLRGPHMQYLALIKKHQKLRHQLNIHKISESYIMEQQNSESFIPFFLFKKKKNQKHAS
jgi:hypothetical protein